jgi:hypothetical protein
MKRFDVYRNPEQRTRAHVPYFVVVQSDLIEDFDTRVVVPLMRQRAAATRLNPIIEFAGESWVKILKTKNQWHEKWCCVLRPYSRNGLSVVLLELLRFQNQRNYYLAPNDQGLQLTEKGYAWAKQLGLELPKKSATRFAYPCMDWSERKDHLAGSLAKALLEFYVAKNWLRAPKQTRALELTHLGQEALMPLLKNL